MKKLSRSEIIHLIEIAALVVAIVMLIGAIEQYASCGLAIAKYYKEENGTGCSLCFSLEKIGLVQNIPIIPKLTGGG
jgi:hypothetical protein